MIVNYEGFGKSDLVQSVVTDYGYVFGGHNGSANVATNQEYDTLLNSWISQTNLTTARRDNPACNISNEAFSMGGREVDNTNKNQMFVNNTWTSKTNMSIAIRAHIAVSMGDLAYIFGGYTTTYTNKTEEYSNNSWTTKTNTPQSYANLGGFKIDDSIVIFRSNLTYEYISNAFVSKIAYPIDAGAMGYSTQKLSLGGASYFNDILEYDLVTNSWTSKTDLDNDRGYLTSTQLNDVTHAFGGKNSSTTYNRNTQFKNNTVTQKTVMSEAKTIQASTYINK